MNANIDKVESEGCYMATKGTCRLYDKDFNLLATWPTDENLYFVEDSEDGRRSGIVTKVEFCSDPTY